ARARGRARPARRRRGASHRRRCDLRPRRARGARRPRRRHAGLPARGGRFARAAAERRRGERALMAQPSPAPSPAGEDSQLDVRLVGYLICSRYDTVWHIMNVAVDVGRQREGLASLLLAELYERVGDENARYTLEVRRSNVIAIHLYEREGFRAAGMRRRYYQDNGEDALVIGP